MNRAGLALELGAELLEYRVDGEQDAPEALDGHRIVGGVNAVLVEGNRIGDFDRRPPDFHFNTCRMNHVHDVSVKVGHRTRDEREGFERAIAGLKDELVAEKVEPELKRQIATGNAGGGESAGGDVERNVPPMVHD